MTSDVACNFAPACRVAHMDRIFEVELFSQHCEIVGVGVHVVAVPGLAGAAVASPVVRDDSIAALAEEQHLSIPIVRGERPSVAEHYGLTRAPVLVINLRTVFCGNRWHTSLLNAPWLSLSVFIQVFAGHVILRHFMSVNFPSLFSSGLFDA